MAEVAKRGRPKNEELLTINDIFDDILADPSEENILYIKSLCKGYYFSRPTNLYKPRVKKCENEENINAVMALRQEGKSYKKISIETGLSIPTVKKIIDNN